MTGNTSHAVRAQRHEPHDSLDFFPTPPWATRAFIRHVLDSSPSATAWDPACGAGDMALPLAEYFSSVTASDVHDYGWGHTVRDFLLFDADPPDADWIITNPPFRLGEAFALRALSLARVGVAMLVRTAFLEGIGRYDRLFRPHPPQMVAQFVERVPMVKGRLDQDASTATSYAWLVWSRRHWGELTRFTWIPPCRSELERPDDYRVRAHG